MSSGRPVMADSNHIRHAKVSDFDSLMVLYRQLQPDDPILQDGADQCAFAEILRDPKLPIFLLFRGGQACASTYLNVVPNITRGAAPYAVIENVVTEERWRGRGFGKQIMAHTLEFAWREGCYKAMLQTGSKRASTHAFYRACGFSDVEKRGYLARPTGF